MFSENSRTQLSPEAETFSNPAELFHLFLLQIVRLIGNFSNLLRHFLPI